MNYIVPVTAETIMRRALDGTFMAWNRNTHSFELITVEPDFIPSFAKTGFTDAMRATKPRPWTKPEIDKLIEMRGRRLIWRIIAEEMNRGPDACCWTYLAECKRRGIEPVRTCTQRRYLTDDDKARALDMRTQDIPIRTIASWLGLTRRNLGEFLSAHAARERMERAGVSQDAQNMGRRAIRNAMAAVRGDAACVEAKFNPGALAALPVILDVVAKHFALKPDDLRFGGRTNDIVRARHVYCYVAYKHTSHGYRNVALACGFREHTATLHAVDKINRNLDQYADDVAAIERALGVTG